MSLLFTGYYLLRADEAEDRVRKIRSEQCTVNMMRVSWEKATTPIIWALTLPFRPPLRLVKEYYLPRLTQEVSTRYVNWRNDTRVKVYYCGTQ